MGEPFSADDPLPQSVRARWASRPVAVQRSRIVGRYARFHAPLAVLSSIVAILPLFTEAVSVDGTYIRVDTYVGLTNLDGQDYTGLALLLSALLLGLAALLAVASFWANSAVPVLSSLVALALLLVLWIGPDQYNPAPGPSWAGLAAVVIALWSVPLGLAHAIHLSRVPTAVPVLVDHLG